MPHDYYLNVSRASDLEKTSERILYRFLEMLPGLLSWGTLAVAIVSSWLFPLWAAFFAIAFVIYWFLRSIYFAFHLRAGYLKMAEYEKVNWQEKLASFPAAPSIYQLVTVVMYEEPYEIVRATLLSLKNADFARERMIVVLATEESARQEAADTARRLQEEFQGVFFRFAVTRHPAGLAGEIPGKGSNEAFATTIAKDEIINPLALPYSSVILTSLDADTVVPAGYFSCLAYHYLSASDPEHSSFQPIPLFVNNIGQASAISRIFSFSATFWQTMNQERPEKLITFSSHSMSFKALVDVGMKMRNVVSDDSRIFWQCFLRYNGTYQVYPLHYPVSMDANAAPSLWETMKNMYKQQRRWAYGAAEIPYVLFGFLKNKNIPLAKKFFLGWDLLEGFWSWACAPFLIFLLGWMPLLLGGQEFSQTLLSYNLPRFTSIVLTVAMLGLITSAIITMNLLATRRQKYGTWSLLVFAFQWVLFPFTMIFFTALPALDAQTRLMVGAYMGFWPTPKFRPRKP